ncbi:MAG: hypothetical protein COA94_05740 [Rickettsiales bacterium]|nr:MAG: hypothetical protein COA94_05740 [Rickettsiales bacterium]
MGNDNTVAASALAEKGSSLGYEFQAKLRFFKREIQLMLQQAITMDNEVVVNMDRITDLDERFKGLMDEGFLSCIKKANDQHSAFKGVIDGAENSLEIRIILVDKIYTQLISQMQIIPDLYAASYIVQQGLTTYQGDCFNGFMHFIATNETDPRVLELLTNSWLAAGRSLSENNGTLSTTTPLNIALLTDNVPFITALVERGVDITAPNEDGTTALHLLIYQIHLGISDISFLQKWLDAGLEVDLRAKLLAQKLELTEVTNLIGEGSEIVQQTLDELVASITQNYLDKMILNGVSDIILTNFGDPNAMLLHYLIENHNTVPLSVFKHFLDSELLVRGIIDSRKTALQHAVEMGAVNFSVAMAEHGIGTTELDNGRHIIEYVHYIGGEHKAAFVEAIKASQAIDMSGEQAAQLIADALIAKNGEFVATLVKAGADINHNDHELLKMFIKAGADYSDQIELAVLHGAEITGDMLELAAAHGLGELLTGLKQVQDQEAPVEMLQDGAITTIKALLVVMSEGSPSDEIMPLLVTLRMQGLYNVLQQKPALFEQFCKQEGIWQEMVSRADARNPREEKSKDKENVILPSHRAEDDDGNDEALLAGVSATAETSDYPLD